MDGREILPWEYLLAKHLNISSDPRSNELITPYNFYVYVKKFGPIKYKDEKSNIVFSQVWAEGELAKLEESAGKTDKIRKQVSPLRKQIEDAMKSRNEKNRLIKDINDQIQIEETKITNLNDKIVSFLRKKQINTHKENIIKLQNQRNEKQDEIKRLSIIIQNLHTQIEKIERSDQNGGKGSKSKKKPGATKKPSAAKKKTSAAKPKPKKAKKKTVK